MLAGGLNRGEILFRHTAGRQPIEILRAVDRSGAAISVVAQALVALNESRRVFVHHHAAVFAIGDLSHQRRDRGGSELNRVQPHRFVEGLHLPHQLCVGALGFDQRRDLGQLAGAIAGSKLMGNEAFRVAEPGAIGVLHAVFLHQQPAVARLFQGHHQGVEHIGVIGQVHLR